MIIRHVISVICRNNTIKSIFAFVVRCPHLGQERADSDISYPHLGHLYSAIVIDLF